MPAVVVGRFAERRNRIHPAARRRSAAFDAAAALARPGSVRLQRTAVVARFLASALRRSGFLTLWQKLHGEDAGRSAVAPRLDRIREDAGDGRRPDQSVHLLEPYAQRQQRAYHAFGRRLGNVLPRQALVGDAPARPRQAQAHVPVRRHPFRDRRRFGRCQDDARNIDAPEELVIRAQGHSRHVRAAGLPGILSRRRVQSGDGASRPCQPCRDRNDLRGGEFRDRSRRLLLSHSVELLRRTARALWAGRAASSRIDGVCDRTRAAALRFHHRRRALQERMVRPAFAALRLQRGRDLARLAGERAVGGAAAAQALPSSRRRLSWRVASQLRSLYGALLGPRELL